MAALPEATTINVNDVIDGNGKAVGHNCYDRENMKLWFKHKKGPYNPTLQGVKFSDDFIKDNGGLEDSIISSPRRLSAAESVTEPAAYITNGGSLRRNRRIKKGSKKQTKKGSKKHTNKGSKKQKKVIKKLKQ
jgi:hypothetical protein